ncbi:unnamed protein product [Caenorhabditis bovis]|uniref:Suppressor of forked domain-containing protein n=1 Tax=Caenorhabditis bovis TaxID=2654633 RepID=A0A8S1E9G4_9PELO|nr:unnamed protein product [Caenorhabditis bovis]
MGRSRSRSRSSSDDDRERERSDRRYRDDKYRDRDRDRRRRSRSRSNSPHKRGSTRRRDDSRDGGRRSTDSRRNKPIRPTIAAHIGPPAIDPQDFDNWVQILNKCDQNDDVEYTSEKYAEFLKRYPYCYGFWTKYAEYQKKYNTLEESKKVWERGILAVPLSIDLWLGYIGQMRSVPGFPVDSIRELYKRALEIAGLEYQSDRLWLDAIGFEQIQYIHEMCSQNEDANCRRIGELFDRLLGTPTLHAATHFDRYVAYINTIQPNLLLSEEEYEDVLRIAKRDLNKGIDDEVYHEVDQVYIVKPMADNKTLTVSAVEEEGTFKVTVRRLEFNEDVLRVMRNEIAARRRKIFDRNLRQCEMRALFEANIKRPYFHVKPLDNVQLFNWLTYLDFEIQQGDPERIEILFERCLIACALYEEFWIKYARWAWKENKSESTIRDIFKRAKVHIPNSLNITLAHSGFEESIDDFECAADILERFRRDYPGYVNLEMRYVGILRRQCEKEGSMSFSKVVSTLEKLITRSENSPNLMSFYSLKLARFHQKIRKDSKLAQKVIKKALETDKGNLQLYTQLVDIAYSNPDMKESEVIDAFDFALVSSLPPEDKIRFSQRKMDFLEELGMDVLAIEEHREFHYNLLAQLPDTNAIRTRFVNEPSRVMVVPQPIAQPPVMWPMQQPMQPPLQPMLQQQPPPMGMPPMMPMQQTFMAQPPPMQPKVHLQLIEQAHIPPQQASAQIISSPMIAGGDGGSGTPMDHQ